MIKILVTTDFSDNSKAGLRYAIQIASQQKTELIFFHAYNISIPSLWSILRKGAYEKEQESKIHEALKLFVAQLYKGMNIVEKQNKYIVRQTSMPQAAIMEYAADNNCNYICISTRGAGKLMRLLGTNTANLINFSPVPVIAVPYNYKVTAIKMVLYASDFLNLQMELKKVVAFAKPLHATVDLLHFTSPLEAVVDAKMIAGAIRKSSRYDIKLNLKSRNPLETLLADIKTAIRSTKPSLLIMFTEQNRDLFQRIFISSKSAEYSFHAAIPILVFNKS